MAGLLNVALLALVCLWYVGVPDQCQNPGIPPCCELGGHAFRAPCCPPPCLHRHQAQPRLGLPAAQLHQHPRSLNDPLNSPSLLLLACPCSVPALSAAPQIDVTDNTLSASVVPTFPYCRCDYNNQDSQWRVSQNYNKVGPSTYCFTITTLPTCGNPGALCCQRPLLKLEINARA